MNYLTARIRDFIKKTFSDEEVEIFCFDYFRDVYDQFSAGMSKSRKIQLLIVYCESRSTINALVDFLKSQRPASSEMLTQDDATTKTLNDSDRNAELFDKLFLDFLASEKGGEIWRHAAERLISGKSSHFGRGTATVNAIGNGTSVVAVPVTKVSQGQVLAVSILTVLIVRGSNPRTDIQRLEATHQVLKSFEGFQHFQIRLIGGSAREATISFPQDTTRDCPELRESLALLLGADCVL